MSTHQLSWTCSRCLLRILRRSNVQDIHPLRFYSTSSAEHHDLISPVLLARARGLATEQAQLEEQIALGYDSKAARKAGELGPVTAALKQWDRASESLRELRSLIQEPNTDKELRAMATEDMSLAKEELEKVASAITRSLVTKHPFEHLPCILEIKPGAGGGEAALFAADLLRMYLSYCSANNLHTTIVRQVNAEGMGDPSRSDQPLQQAIIEISNEGAYGNFRSEAGVHRVQRVPATETKGRTHTSSASVLVMPSFSEGAESNDDHNDPSSDFYVDPKDVRTDIMRARGAGGQHVNTTDSAVRLTHLPTGTTVSMQDYRSQPKNREKAWQILRARLAQAKRDAREEEAMKTRRSIIGVAKMGREHKIRTYNYSQQRVTDHRSGLSVHDLDDVVTGGPSLDKVMESVKQWMVDCEIEEMAAGGSSGGQ